tara:strand:+ start:10338 stop:11666 length:1329 start_codon:yes stop_codon:yes gene_type:complete
MIKNHFIDGEKKKIISILNKNFRDCYPDRYLNKYVFIKKKKINIGDTSFTPSKKKLFIIGFGKVAPFLAKGLISIIGRNKIHSGLIICPEKNLNLKLKKIKILKSSHPLPDINTFYATSKLLEFISNIPKDGKIICLVSGGGSASLCKPLKGIHINDYLKLTKNLILSEIPIYDINAIRGYFSGVKNGKLANLLYPRMIYNLIVSDDPKNIISSIGSGATVYSKNKYGKVLELLKKKKIKILIPKKLLPIKNYYSSNNFLKKKNTFNKIVFNNYEFLKQLKQNALINNIEKIKIFPKVIEGNTNLAKSKIIKFIQKNKINNRGILLLFGIETFVDVKDTKNSYGGRLQHLSLVLIKDLNKLLTNFLFFSVATDGNDYIKKISGVIYNDKDCEKFLKKENITYLNDCIKKYNSYSFFKYFNCILRLKKPTQNNVMDVIGVLIK